MSDIIGRTIPVSMRVTEKIGAVASAAPLKREHPHDDSDYEDLVDVAPQQHLEQGPEEITLSLQMVLALIEGDLPEEAVKALSAFAPLGEKDDIAAGYDRMVSKGHENIDWPNTMSLAQALATAASI